MKRDKFKKFWDEITTYDLSKPLTASAMTKLTTLLSKLFGAAVTSKVRSQLQYAAAALTKEYRKFSNAGFKELNRGLKGWRVNKLKEDFRKELKRRIQLNAELISPNKKDLQDLVKMRFAGLMSKGKTSVGELKQTLKLSSTINLRDKKVKNTLIDQKQKMIAEFNQITGKEYNAIGFLWLTRDDRLVAGNPRGEYPNVDDNSHIHGNHHKRDGVVFLYKNSWVLKNRLVKKDAENIKIFEDVCKDGYPGIPINCRCVAANIYELDDLVKESGASAEDILTEKGLAIYERKKRGLFYD